MVKVDHLTSYSPKRVVTTVYTTCCSYYPFRRIRRQINVSIKNHLQKNSILFQTKKIENVVIVILDGFLDIFCKRHFDQQSRSKNLLLIGYPTLNSNLEQTLLCAIYTFLSDLTFGLLSSQRLICVRVIIMEVGFSTISDHRGVGATLGRQETYVPISFFLVFDNSWSFIAVFGGFFSNQMASRKNKYSRIVFPTKFLQLPPALPLVLITAEKASSWTARSKLQFQSLSRS